MASAIIEAPGCRRFLRQHRSGHRVRRRVFRGRPAIRGVHQLVPEGARQAVADQCVDRDVSCDRVVRDGQTHSFRDLGTNRRGAWSGGCHRPSRSRRIRQGLNVESGLNDGLVVPAVALFLSFAADTEDSGSARFWARFAFEQIGVGLLVGVLVGATGALLLNHALAHDWVDGAYAQLATFSLAIAALATSVYFDGNGFIAAFVAGMAFGHIAEDHEHLGEFTEDTAQLAAAVSFFLFGNVLLGPALDNFGPAIAGCAIAILTVGRVIPVAIAMVGSKAALPTMAFVGWFGPRGLASILFGLLLLEEDLPMAEQLFAVVAWTVLLSVVLHGATAAWGARRYGAWWATMSEDERESMPEGLDVPDQRPRRI